jgi:hypothetical protein
MKATHKILYSCGNCDSGDFSHRLLLVRTGNYSDSWKSFLYSESIGEVFQRSSVPMPIDNAIHQAQLAAIRNGISPILSDKQEFAA